MLIHLAKLGEPYLDQPAGHFAMHAATDRVRAHELTDSPEDADIILFTQCHMLPEDWRLKRLREHPLRRTYPKKVLVYNELDRPWCTFPGVYVNMPAGPFVEAHQRPWGYFVPPPAASDLAPDLLFSFIASNTALCRRPLFTLQHPGAIVEEVQGFRFWDATSTDFDKRRVRFQSILARSRFVLCPRGNGTSSVRLYEALAAGVVPVIISDDWVAPSGPSWEEFSIRWPEGRIDGLLEMLEARDSDWPRMSREARRAHDEYFSPEVCFHHVAELCHDLLREGAPAAFPARGVIDRHFATRAAEHARNRMRYKRAVVSRKARRIASNRAT
jgi:Exostosin family